MQNFGILMKTYKIKSSKTYEKLHTYGSDFLNNYRIKLDQIFTVDVFNAGPEHTKISA